MKVVTTTPVKEFDTITVELKYDEALVIRDILNNIGGSTTLSRRRYVDDMARELLPYFLKVKTARDMEGVVHFRGNPR